MAVPTNPPGLSCQASRSGPIFRLGLFRVYETNLETLSCRLRPFPLNGYAWVDKTHLLFDDSVTYVSHKLEVFPDSHPYGTGTVGKPLTRSKRWAVHFRYRTRSLEVTALYLWVP